MSAQVDAQSKTPEATTQDDRAPRISTPQAPVFACNQSQLKMLRWNFCHSSPLAGWQIADLVVIQWPVRTGSRYQGDCENSLTMPDPGLGLGEWAGHCGIVN